MIYRVIGLMSGSSIDGLDIVFAELEASGGKWSWSIPEAECIPYPPEWARRLSADPHGLSALAYQELHTEFGHYLGRQVKAFMQTHGLDYKVSLIASHGHTTFHLPGRMTAQWGDGAAIAAETGLPVVSDLRAMDVALGGQGAPIVPMGERLLWPGYRYFLNIGGIANISFHGPERLIAFDTSPANRVLNALASEAGQAYDAGGAIAASGKVDPGLLSRLNQLEYYAKAYPRSLDNAFGTETVLPLIVASGLPLADRMATMAAHIAQQVRQAVIRVRAAEGMGAADEKMLVTGGGAFNTTLLELIRTQLEPLGILAEAADERTIEFKEALVMALLGVLRWREEETVLSSVTGASRSSVGGALWMGTR